MTMVGGREIARGAVVGLVAGLLAAGAMSLAHRALRAADREPVGSDKPEDPTIVVARAAASLAGSALDEDEKSRAGAAVHYAFGAAIGALYGAVAEVIPRVTTALGVPFGIAVWLGAHVVAVPALGLSEPPTRQPIGQEAEELGLHVVYGSVTEFVRRLLHRL
jgi:putative membrane protein